jgi:ATP/ADP translocase
MSHLLELLYKNKTSSISACFWYLIMALFKGGIDMTKREEIIDSLTSLSTEVFVLFCFVLFLYLDR